MSISCKLIKKWSALLKPFQLKINEFSIAHQVAMMSFLRQTKSTATWSYEDVGRMADVAPKGWGPKDIDGLSDAIFGNT